MAASGPRRTLPPLNALRAFEAAARHGSVKAAADELAVTHGAVSRQIQLLQAWLGGPRLFRRVGRGLAPTQDGEALLAVCGGAFEQLAQACRRHGSAGRVLRVNALATFSLRWLLPRLARFRAAHPQIEVRLTTANDPVDALAEDYDVVIRGGPDSFHGYAAHRLVDEWRLPVCSPATLARLPLAGPGDLARHTLLHVATMPRLWQEWLAAAGAPHLAPAAALTLDHFYLAIQAALDGLGVAMGPTTLVADDIAAGRLVAPFPAPRLPARSYYAYLPQGGPERPEGAVFCAWLAGLADD